jgi:predicted acyltransferase
MTSPAPAGPARLLALDVFRGATVAGMLLVNNPGSWSAIYPPLAHAPWHGWTPTDLIFPYFLFIVGVTTHLSLSRRRARGAADAVLVRHILVRGGLIVLFGLLLNAFPYWPAERWTHLRYAGVLQRIGVVYIACALLTLRTSLRAQAAILAAILFGYWALMTLVTVDGALGALVLSEPSRTLAAALDRALLGADHIWQYSRTWDPEGPLSTLPAIGSAMLGVFAGRWLQSPRPLAERIAGLCGLGAPLMALGLGWGWSFPINKNLWTSSYVLFTGGMAAVSLGVCLWVIDDRGVKGWTAPFEAFGVNPMLAFLGTGVMGRVIGALWRVDLDGRSVTVQQLVYERAFASWLEPRDASLAFALGFVLLWLLLLWPLYRRRIHFKV